MASSSANLTYSVVTESADISSSSQVISQELVDFRSVEQLQEQNQRLLMVVRELSEQNEERERQTVADQTKVSTCARVAPVSGKGSLLSCRDLE